MEIKLLKSQLCLFHRFQKRNTNWYLFLQNALYVMKFLCTKLEVCIFITRIIKASKTTQSSGALTLNLTVKTTHTKGALMLNFTKTTQSSGVYGNWTIKIKGIAITCNHQNYPVFWGNDRFKTLTQSLGVLRWTNKKQCIFHLAYGWSFCLCLFQKYWR